MSGRFPVDKKPEERDTVDRIERRQGASHAAITTHELSGQNNTLIGKIENGESFIITKEAIPCGDMTLRAKKATWKRPIEKLVMPKGLRAGIC